MLKFSTMTNSGGRSCNEDCFKVSSVSNKQCFVVCDGLGGYQHGDVAAKLAANTFVDELCFTNNLTMFLETSFNSAQKKIMDIKSREGQSNAMKTTAVCFVTDGEKGFVGHIGDSRFYAFKKEKNEYIRTLDHSVPQLLVQSGTIKDSEIRNHPNRNMLLKVMGERWEEPLYEIHPIFAINDYDAYLLCSDGFWELISEDEMINTFKDSLSPDEWLEKMVAIVEENGCQKKMDNYTAIAIINDIK